MITILYGAEVCFPMKNYLDITLAAIKCCTRDNILIIPANDFERSLIFGDPVPGSIKHIKILFNNKEYIYQSNETIIFDLKETEIEENQEKTVLEKLFEFHESLNFEGGSMLEEFPEQVMSMIFLDKNDIVLEIGSNIGRNSLVISLILNSSTNLVSLETDSEIFETLKINRDNNEMNFIIENSALSKKRLFQKEWVTIPSDSELPDYKEVKTITFQDLKEKYNKSFTALVADCEGSLFYIFQDFPEILDEVRKVIIENDYQDLNNKNLVDSFLIKKGFRCIYTRPGGWGCCYSRFFETWIKSD